MPIGLVVQVFLFFWTQKKNPTPQKKQTKMNVALERFWEERAAKAKLVAAHHGKRHHPPTQQHRTVCKYWLKDRCMLGTDCQFMHILPSSGES
jgi:hypothetical protein